MHVALAWGLNGTCCCMPDIQNHWKTFNAALRAPAGAGGLLSAGVSDGGSPVEARRMAIEAGRRLSDSGAPTRSDIRIKDR